MCQWRCKLEKMFHSMEAFGKREFNLRSLVPIRLRSGDGWNDTGTQNGHLKSTRDKGFGLRCHNCPHDHIVYYAKELVYCGWRRSGNITYICFEAFPHVLMQCLKGSDSKEWGALCKGSPVQFVHLLLLKTV